MSIKHQEEPVSVLGYQNTEIQWIIVYFLKVGNNEILTIANFLASPFRLVIPSLDCSFQDGPKKPEVRGDTRWWDFHKRSLRTKQSPEKHWHMNI